MIVTAAAVAVAVVIGLAVLRAVLRRRALDGRTVRRVLLPTPKFSPTVEEIDRFAAVLARTHRATRGFGTRPAYATRIRLCADEGLVRYELHGHRRALSVLSAAGFDQTENLPVDAATDTDTMSRVATTEPSETSNG